MDILRWLEARKLEFYYMLIGTGPSVIFGHYKNGLIPELGGHEVVYVKGGGIECLCSDPELVTYQSMGFAFHLFSLHMIVKRFRYSWVCGLTR